MRGTKGTGSASPGEMAVRHGVAKPPQAPPCCQAHVVPISTPTAAGRFFINKRGGRTHTHIGIDAHTHQRRKLLLHSRCGEKGQCPLPPRGGSKITCSCQHPHPQPQKLLTSTTVPCHVPRTAQGYIPKGAILEWLCWARDMFPSHRGFLSLPLTGPVLRFLPLWHSVKIPS